MRMMFVAHSATMKSVNALINVEKQTSETVITVIVIRDSPSFLMLMTKLLISSVIGPDAARNSHCDFGGGGSFFLACEELGRMCNRSFPTCDFFFFF